MNYTCPTCNGQWTSDYCPQCGSTIAEKANQKEPGNLQPLCNVEQPIPKRSQARRKIHILWKILAIVTALCITTAAVLWYTKPSSQEFAAYIATKGIPPGVLYFQIKSPFFYSDNCVFDGKEITHRYIGVIGRFYEVNPPKKRESADAHE